MGLRCRLWFGSPASHPDDDAKANREGLDHKKSETLFSKMPGCKWWFFVNSSSGWWFLIGSMVNHDWKQPPYVFKSSKHYQWIFWTHYLNDISSKTAFQWYFQQDMSDMSLFFFLLVTEQTLPKMSPFSHPPKQETRKTTGQSKWTWKIRRENTIMNIHFKCSTSNMPQAFKNKSSWWFQIFVSHPYLQKQSNLTHIFQMGWLDQPEITAPLQLDAFTWRPRPCGAALPNFHHFGGKRIERSQHGGEPWLPGGGKCVAAPWDWICEQGGIKVF